MHALRLDFVQSPRRLRSSLLLLVAGAVAAIALAFWRADLQGDTQALESQLARLERQAKGLGSAPVRIDESAGQEVRRAGEVIDQLAMPWDRLFRAIEGAAAEQVTLLGIVPDARSGSVQISAQAADAQAMFDYVKGLEQQSELAGVYLLEHQHDKRGGSRPLRFVVTASWIAPQARP